MVLVDVLKFSLTKSIYVGPLNVRVEVNYRRSYGMDWKKIALVFFFGTDHRVDIL